MQHYNIDYLQAKTDFLTIGHQINYYPSLHSTMPKARALIAQGTAEGAIVLAGEQTAAHGRLQRSWLSPPGNMSLSLILYPAAERLPWLFAVSALAVKNTLQLFNIKSSFKWPNDILVGGRKIAGILIEGLTQKEQTKVICGVGLNINLQTAQYEDISHTAISMTEYLGREVDVNEVVATFLQQFDTLYIKTAIKSIYEQWKKAMHFLGEWVTVCDGSTGICVSGRALDVDDSGRLLVTDENGIQHLISNGELSLL